MAAFSFSAANPQWERAFESLMQNGFGGFTQAASPAAVRAMRNVQLWLATQKFRSDIQILAWDGSSSSGPAHANGVVLATGAASLYAMWAIKPNTSTDVYLVAFDDATDDAGAGTDGRVVLPFLVGNDESFFLAPQGLVLAAGCVIKAYTDFDGTSDSTATDVPSGFAVFALN